VDHLWPTVCAFEYPQFFCFAPSASFAPGTKNDSKSWLASRNNRVNLLGPFLG
jgi:hypothetical protein